MEKWAPKLQEDVLEQRYGIKMSYKNERQSFVQSAREFIRNNRVLESGLMISAIGMAGMALGAAYQSHMETSILVEHGRSALDAYREMASLHEVPIGSGVKAFIDAMTSGDWTAQKTTLAGLATMQAGFGVMVAGKIIKAMTNKETTKEMMLSAIETSKPYKTGASNLGETLQSYSQMGVLERIKNCWNKPGLFSLVNQFEDFKKNHGPTEIVDVVEFANMIPPGSTNKATRDRYDDLISASLNPMRKSEGAVNNKLSM